MAVLRTEGLWQGAPEPWTGSSSICNFLLRRAFQERGDGMMLRSAVRVLSFFASAVFAAGCLGSPRASAGERSRALSDVGTVSVALVDASRRDPLESALPRTWMVQVFYPARPSAVVSTYADDPVLLEELIRENYYDTGEAV